MVPTYVQPLIEMSMSLAELACKDTFTAITNKIKTIKDEKNTEKLRGTYDEIISKLLDEREEAVRIAKAYKSELERIVISDEDIEHLYNTVSKILEIVKTLQLAAAVTKGPEEIAKVNAQVEIYEQVKKLISIDTLKTMQLLGFNYKAAIGEPLTQMCANAISNMGNKQKSSQSNQFKNKGR